MAREADRFALVTPALLRDAGHLVDAPWNQHYPLLSWLVDLLRPGRAVELGTGEGASFRALCDVVERTGGGGTCVAVDSWRGEGHRGWVDSSAHQDLTSLCHAHYGDVATILRMSGGEALEQFPPTSIDLLHVAQPASTDGIAYDVAGWAEKVRPGGVVLVSGVLDLGRQDEAWKAWQTIAGLGPSVLLDHGQGVGLVQLPAPGAPPLVEALREHPQFVSLLRLLGDRIQFENLLGTGPTTAAGVRLRMSRLLSEQQERLRTKLEAVEWERDLLQRRLDEARDTLSTRAHQLSERDAQIDLLKAKVAFYAGKHQRELEELREAHVEEMEPVQAHLAAVCSELAARTVEIEDMRGSTSWKVTYPIRLFKRLASARRP